MRKVLKGIVCGLVACLIQWVVDSYFGLGCSLGIRTVGVITAAFFFGCWAGCAAGVTAMIYGGIFGWHVGGFDGVISGVVSSAFVTAASIGIRRYTLFGRRPCAMAAAFYAMLVALVHVSVIFVLGVSRLQDTLALVRVSAIPMVLTCAILAALFALLLRVPCDRASSRRCLAAAIAFVGLILAVWLAESRACLAVGRAQMDVLGETLVTEIDYLVEPTAFRMAQAIVDEAGTIDRAVATGADVWAKRLHVSRVDLVDKKGIVVASSDSKAVGEDYHASEAMCELLSGIIECGERYASARFRPVVTGEEKRFYKFVAIAFPGGGCALVGEELSDYDTRFDYIYELAMVDWPAGKNGTYVLINPKTKKVVSAMWSAWIGKPISETGLDKIALLPGGGEVRASVMGLDAYVRRLSIDFADMDAYMVIPVDEIMTTRNLSAVVFATALTIIFIFGSMLLAKIFRQQESIRAFYALEEAHRAQDLKLAQDIQISAMPSDFTPIRDDASYELYACMRTAKEVGGDFFDFFPYGEGRLFIVIADVSGKGVPAALFMMKTKAAIRAAARPGVPLTEIVAEVNRNLCADNTSDMFVTAWVGIYDLSTGEIEYVSAGHNPPYIRHADGGVVKLQAPRALVLAAMPTVHYRSSSARLDVDDRIVLYTDGVTEAVAHGREFFGEPRLADVLVGCGGSAEQTCQCIVKQIDAFARDMPQADDITVLTLVHRRV